MTTYRKVIFANEQVYHVYNRGVEKRRVFTNRREYARALDAISFYRFADLPIRLSKFLVIQAKEREALFKDIVEKHTKLVDILVYCLMPNHFHFLLRQKRDIGISTFVANVTNSYTKYFNVKHERVGALFQGLFKAVWVEDEEQLLHLSRYIHLNPVSSFLIKPEELQYYEWSSYPEYLGAATDGICDTKTVLSSFSSVKKYVNFVMDQVFYAQELEKIKHSLLE